PQLLGNMRVEVVLCFGPRFRGGPIHQLTASSPTHVARVGYRAQNLIARGFPEVRLQMAMSLRLTGGVPSDERGQGVVRRLRRYDGLQKMTRSLGQAAVRRIVHPSGKIGVQSV